MKVSIVFSQRVPLKVYLNHENAIAEYERLRDLGDGIDYSIVEMTVDESSGVTCNACKDSKPDPFGYDCYCPICGRQF